jgi:putative ABC transport system ATP-binding protein
VAVHALGAARQYEAGATVRVVGGRIAEQLGTSLSAGSGVVASGGAVVTLDNVTVGFGKGQFTAIMGPSGSGKSTLMHCVAGLDTINTGRIFIGDVDLSGLNDKQLTRMRRDTIGFVFQAFNLVPTLTALENITLAQGLAAIETLGARVGRAAQARARVDAIHSSARSRG